MSSFLDKLRAAMADPPEPKPGYGGRHEVLLSSQDFVQSEFDVFVLENADYWFFATTTLNRADMCVHFKRLVPGAAQLVERLLAMARDGGTGSIEFDKSSPEELEAMWDAQSRFDCMRLDYRTNNTIRQVWTLGVRKFDHEAFARFWKLPSQ